MRYRTFGRTGWNISEIGFGAWQIGGEWGKVDDNASVATLLHAFEKGINFVDTAEMYGRGHSETVIGRALKEWRGGKIFVATKTQPLRWPDADDDRPEMRGRYPAWHLRANVEASLKRLGVERLDLFQLHCWMPDGLVALDWLETINTLRQEGKIDHVGVSIRDFRPEDGVDLARFGLVDSIQVIFNMFEQRPAGDLFSAGASTGTAFIGRVPLDSGSLIGHWTENGYSGFEPGSQPHQMFRGARYAETFRRVEELKALCRPYFPTLAEAAMRFALSPPQLSTLIPGMKTKAEVDMNIAYCDGRAFPEDLRAALAGHAWIRNYYT
jgi:aryl-alcohol dehydrogenase-like predicted oxidoreductase